MGSLKNILGLRCVVVFGCLIVLVNCSKDLATEQTSTRLRFIHASPNAGKISFLLNEKAAFSQALSYTDTTPYKTYSGGTYNVQVAIGGVQAVNTVIDFLPASAYSFFAIDSSNKLKLLVVKDDPTPTSLPLRTKLRFFNLIPNAGALALVSVSNGDTSVLFGSRIFNQTSSGSPEAGFTEFFSGSYKLLLFSSNGLLATLPVSTFKPYKNYTVYAIGFQAGLGNQAPSLALIPNN